MVDGSNDASWPKEVPFEYADDEKILLEVYDPKTAVFSPQYGNPSSNHKTT